MRAALDDAAVVEHGDAVAEAAGGKAVADVDRGPVADDLVELLVDLHLGDRVERGGRLVEHDERRVHVERAGERDLLRLAARDLHALLVEVLVELRLEAVRKLREAVAETSLLQAGLCALGVVLHGGRHVLAEGEGEQLKVLKHDREQRDVLVVVVLADVDAVEQDRALGGVVEAAEQLDERRLARAVFADDREPLADAELHRDMAQRVVLGAGVAERNVAEFDLVVAVAALLGRQAALIHLARRVEEFIGLAQEDGVRAEFAPGGDERADAAGKRGDRADVLRDAAHRERAGPGLQADERVNEAGENGRNGRRGAGPKAHRAAGAFGEGAVNAQQIFLGVMA